MYMCARGMDFACFYEFSIGFWNCSNSEVFFVFQPIKILTESPLDVRRYDNRSPPSINSSIINCGSLSRQTPSKLNMWSCLKLLINTASFRNSSFSWSEALFLNVWKYTKYVSILLTVLKSWFCFVNRIENHDYLILTGLKIMMILC